MTKPVSISPASSSDTFTIDEQLFYETRNYEFAVPPMVSIVTDGGITRHHDQVIAGTADQADAGAVVSLSETIQGSFQGDIVYHDLGSTIVDADGYWSLSVVLASDDASSNEVQHNVVAHVTDAAGIIGTSNSVTFIFGQNTSAQSYAATLSQVDVDVVNGLELLTGPQGDRHDVTGIGTLNFTDGTINQKDGQPLVDDLFYFSHNLDVWNAHVDADAHYNGSGWREGRDPNAYFSTSAYLAANPDIAAAGINPLAHYDANGWKEGRDPSAAFDTTLYLQHNPDVAAAGIDPLAHYLANGQAEGRQAYAAIGPSSSFTHGSFDAEYYLLANPDVAKVAASTADPYAFAYQHYETNGWHEGRNPNAYFDTSGYLGAYADVAAAGIDPLAHYDANGWKEGRDPSGAFDTKAYLAQNADVAAAGVDPLQHFLTSGVYEGRAAGGDGHFA